MLGFAIFGVPHLFVLGITAGVAYFLCLSAKGSRRAGNLDPGSVGPKLRVAEYALAVGMCLTYPLQLFFVFYHGNPNAGNLLPFHLCDVTAYLGAVALITRRPLPSELLYFFGLGATFQGLLTPAGLSHDFPHPGFFIFFAHHSFIVIAAFYVVVGRRTFPRPGAVWRAFLWAQVYLVVVAIANVILGTNYAFLSRKPTGTGSLLDMMGPWPWYIAWLEVAALVVFAILYLPFYIVNRRAARPKNSC